MDYGVPKAVVYQKEAINQPNLPRNPIMPDPSQIAPTGCQPASPNPPSVRDHLDTLTNTVESLHANIDSLETLLTPIIDKIPEKGIGADPTVTGIASDNQCSISQTIQQRTVSIQNLYDRINYLLRNIYL